ncbi:hypothetical protein CRENBAI_017293 [Crenichthys baileyi]|uniref:Uncharacterized protein n=1 Tax=Crenichthys baileyi TaxID=28760 RepID=A0AAV9R1S9_9TELE
MKVLQGFSERTITFNADMVYIISLYVFFHEKIMRLHCSHGEFAFRNLCGLHLICSATTEPAKMMCSERLDKASKTMRSQIISCHIEHRTIDALTKGFNEDTLLLDVKTMWATLIIGEHFGENLV